MTSFRDLESAENPFATRRVRPGAIPYRFPPGRSARALVERLEANGWRGQIVGPHGTGKSSLVATLKSALDSRGRPTFLVELHDGQSRLPLRLRRLAELAPETVLIVDGFEQLAWWRRWMLKSLCRRRGLGLLVTSHGAIGLPDLFRTTTSLALARQIVEGLLGEQRGTVTPDDVTERFAAHQGNLREVLFDLYDVYEQRRLAGRAGAARTDG